MKEELEKELALLEKANKYKTNFKVCLKPQLRQTDVSGSVSYLTEKRFRELFSGFGNSAEYFKNGSKVIVYTLNRKIDNNFNISYHLKFPAKNIQFNFWFDKISYLNSKESVTISFFNGNEQKDKLKNIFNKTA